MSNLQAMYILQSRLGHAAHINYETLRILCNVDLVLVGTEAIHSDVKSQGYWRCLTGAVSVDSMLEFEQVAEAIRAHAADAGYDEFVVATINESKNLLVDRLNAHFGRAPLGQIEKFVRKDKMKDFLVSEGLIGGEYAVIDNGAFRADGREYLRALARPLGYPLFAKPVDMYASKYCARIEGEDDFLRFVEQVALVQPSEFHIEPFREGKLYACDSVVMGGKVAFCQVLEYSHPNVHIHTRPSLGWITLPEDSAVARDLRAFSEPINERMLPDRDGVTHLEAFHHKGLCTFLETAFRPIGGEPSPFYRRRANLPLREVHLALQAGAELRMPEKTPNHVAYIHINFADRPGVVASRSLPEIVSSHEIEWFCRPGERVPVRSGFDAFAGSLLLWNDDCEALREDFCRLLDHPEFVQLDTNYA